MRNLRAAAAVTILATFLNQHVIADVAPLEIKGNKFFYSNNGTQFFIKGIAYQLLYATVSLDSSTYIDPLADGAGCARDIPYMQDLGLNAIRVYAIDTTQNHDDCMNAFADANIYVFADLSAPPDGEGFNLDNPAWNEQLYNRYTSVIDTMQGYSNTAGFLAANTVIESTDDTGLAPYIKAAVRDMKKYIASQPDYRAIPVGYTMNQYLDLSQNLADYFNCGDPSDAVDFMGLKIYTWCDPSTYTVSGYSDLTEQFSSYSVPVFFSEYACTTGEERDFGEVEALYSSQMDGVFSGGIAYEYFQERNNYGLVEVEGSAVTTLQAYDRFKSQLAQATPSAVQSADFVPSNTPADCPAQDASWSASASPLPTDPVAAAVNNGRQSSGSTDTDSPTNIANTGSSSSSDSGLSSGATVGIGVGVGLGAVLLLAIGGFILWKRKRSKKPWLESSDEKDGIERDPAVMLDGDRQRYELEQPQSEMPVGGEAPELEARHGESEMGRSTSSAFGKTQGFEGRHELPGGS